MSFHEDKKIREFFKVCFYLLKDFKIFKSSFYEKFFKNFLKNKNSEKIFRFRVNF